MPIPAIAGIPWLAGVIGALFTTIFGFLATYISKRLAITLTGIVLLTTMTAAFATAIAALSSGISVVLPEFFLQAWSLVVPPNFVACASACMTGRVLRWVYEWNVRIVQLKLF